MTEPDVAPAPIPTKTVTLARAYTDADGKDHKADASIELPRHEANRLLFYGLARLPENSSTKTATVEAILGEVGTDKGKAAAALEAEKAGKNRTTLVSKLEAILSAEEES